MIGAGLLAVGTAVGIVAAHIVPPRVRRFAEPDLDKPPPRLILDRTVDESWLRAFQAAADDFRALGFLLDGPHAAVVDLPATADGTFRVKLRGQDYDDDHVGVCWTHVWPGTTRLARAEIEISSRPPQDGAEAVAAARHLLCHAFGFGPQHVKRTGHWFSASTAKLGTDNRGIRPWIRARRVSD